MTNHDLKLLFRQAFPEDVVDIFGCSRYCDSRRTGLILLASYTRMFGKDAKAYLDLFISFMNEFIEDHFAKYSPTSSLWWELSLFFEEGIQPNNAKKIVAIMNRYFASGETDIDGESALITLHVALSILYRDPSWWCKQHMAKHVSKMKEFPCRYPISATNAFLKYYSTMFNNVFQKNNRYGRETYYLLSEAVVSIYHFTERYLRHIATVHKSIGPNKHRSEAIASLITVIAANASDKI